MTPSPAASGILLVNLLSTWFLVGLIWLVQLVHYPLFAKAGGAEWDAYHRQHIKMITVIIAPTMLVEALAAAALVFAAKEFAAPAKICVWVAAALVLVNWLSTAAVQVPLHNQLGQAWDASVVQKLVASNWIRTVAWTVRGLLLGYVAWQIWVIGNDRSIIHVG